MEKGWKNYYFSCAAGELLKLRVVCFVYRYDTFAAKYDNQKPKFSRRRTEILRPKIKRIGTFTDARRLRAFRNLRNEFPLVTLKLEYP